MISNQGKELCQGTLSGRSLLWVCLVMIGVTTVLYGNTFGNSWTYDDFPVIVNNPDILSWNAFWLDSNPGRPIRELTYLFDHYLFGMTPDGWRIQQILWHGLNGIFICILVNKLSGSIRIGLLTSLLFLCHPIQVEVVANISHRKESLMLCFALLTLLAYQRLTASEQTIHRFIWAVVAIVFFVASIHSKQTGAMILPVIFLYDYLLAPPKKRFLTRPFVLVWVLIAGFGILLWWIYPPGDMQSSYLRGMNGLMHLREGWTDEVTFWVYLLTVLKSWTFMWLRLVWPFSLALEYHFPVPESFFDIWVLSTCTIIIIAVILFFKFHRKEPLAAFAIGWFALFWLPASNLWPLTYFAADRYLYAPSVGFCLFLAIMICRSQVKWKIEINALCAVVLLGLALLTFQQNRVWKDSFSLWNHAVEVSPDASFALNNLGFIYLQRGDMKMAEELLLRSTKNPYNPNPHDNLGWLYEKQGNMPMAAKHYLQFIRIAGNGLQYRERVATLKRRMALE